MNFKSYVGTVFVVESSMSTIRDDFGKVNLHRA